MADVRGDGDRILVVLDRAPAGPVAVGLHDSLGLALDGEPAGVGRLGAAHAVGEVEQGVAVLATVRPAVVQAAILAGHDVLDVADLAGAIADQSLSHHEQVPGAHRADVGEGRRRRTAAGQHDRDDRHRPPPAQHVGLSHRCASELGRTGGSAGADEWTRVRRRRKGECLDIGEGHQHVERTQSVHGRAQLGTHPPRVRA